MRVLSTILATGVLALLSAGFAGCERKPAQSATGNAAKPPPGDAKPVKPVPGREVNVNPVADTRPAIQSVDALDAPDAPRAIPKSFELRGWVKSEPVRVFPIEKLGDLLTDGTTRAVLGTFRLERAAHCAYRREGIIAGVLFLEAASAEDAFGVFSVMTPQPGKLYADGTIRAIETVGDAVIGTGWQGNVFAQVRFTGASGQAPPEESCAGLLASILFNVPSAEAPWLLRAMQGEKAEVVKLWMVRRTAALALCREPALRQLDAPTIDARLGLKGDALLAIAAIRATPEQPVNLVWLVRYPQPGDAQEASARYQAALKNGTSPLDNNTLVADPDGVFLAGSWTKDQESEQGLLKRLMTILPGHLPS